MMEDLAASELKEKGTIQSRVILVVKQQHVKTIKTALEQSDKLDKSTKISLEPQALSEDHLHASDMVNSTAASKGSEEQRMRVPTTYSLDEAETAIVSTDQDVSELKYSILEKLDLMYLHQDISISYHALSTTTIAPTQRSPLHKALSKALGDLPPQVVLSLLTAFPDGYSIYNPMLLLPHNALCSADWKHFLSNHSANPSYIQIIWKHLADVTNTTHVAINSPIPPQTTDKDNILRSPVNITPLYGDFGPPPTPQTTTSPTKDDFDAALWVRTTQNGIHQTWAPLYIMFSRGNIKEKTRILHLPDIDPSSTAVDMYAGIGYFTFSYKRAGVRTIVCFELNPWSVEGLRRGAELNKWTYEIVKEDGLESWLEDRDGNEVNVDFIIFQMSNEHAYRILSRLRATIPPIRHVNLGLLPDARLAWRDAVNLVDEEEGGCVRVHENFGMKDIEARKEEAERVCQGYLDEHDKSKERTVHIEHVERVKMYAPGVVHCVFDLRVHGTRDRV